MAGQNIHAPHGYEADVNSNDIHVDVQSLAGISIKLPFLKFPMNSCTTAIRFPASILLFNCDTNPCEPMLFHDEFNNKTISDKR